MCLSLFGIVSVILLLPSVFQYQARDFFEGSDPECIAAEEGISLEEKDLVIQSGYAVSEEPVSPFSVISIEPYRLRLRDVDIHVYTLCPDGGWMVSVTSILGNHDQSQNTVFYGVDDSCRIVGEVRADLLGVGPVYRNELLDEADHFPQEQNSPVPLSMMDCGSLCAVPWTWMDPEWDDREIVNSVLFVWNGSGFEKVSTRNSDIAESP